VDDKYGQQVAAVSISADPSSTEMTVLQREDSHLQPIIAYLEKKELPTDEKKARRLVLQADQYTILEEYFTMLTSPEGTDGE